MSVPRLGTAIETLAMARLAWALHVTLNSGMDLRNALKMSLAQHAQRRLHAAHRPRAGGDPPGPRDSRGAGPQPASFRSTSSTPCRWAKKAASSSNRWPTWPSQYQDEARLAMNTLTILLGLAVTALIAGRDHLPDLPRLQLLHRHDQRRAEDDAASAMPGEPRIGLPAAMMSRPTRSFQADRKRANDRAGRARCRSAGR